MAGLRQRAGLGPTISRPGPDNSTITSTPATSGRPPQSDRVGAQSNGVVSGARRPSNSRPSDHPTSLQPGGRENGAPQLPPLAGQTQSSHTRQPSEKEREIERAQELTHPAFRNPDPQTPSSSRPQPQDGRYYGPGQNLAPDHDPLRGADGVRYSSQSQPNGAGISGVGMGMGNRSSVQALSQTNAGEPEREGKGGLRKFLRKKGAA